MKSAHCWGHLGVILGSWSKEFDGTRAARAVSLVDFFSLAALTRSSSVAPSDGVDRDVTTGTPAISLFCYTWATMTEE